MNKERKWMEERGFEYIGTAESFRVPKWMECTWRRLPCGKDECKICGRIKQDRLRHIMKGDDPDSMESALEDVGRTLKETLAMVKQDAAERGIDLTNIEDIQEPPEPEDFPLYQRMAKWQKKISSIAEGAEQEGRPWLYMEPAADLLWYKNTLLAKVYRQLCNRWHIEQQDEYGEFDYQYTKYVLGECLKILKKSLAELSEFDARLAFALSGLQEMEGKIMDI